jgi:hypothetical protein
MKKVFIFYLLIVCLMLNTIQANNSSLIILSEMIEESQEIKPQRAKASTMVDTISIYGNENPLSLFLTGTGAIKEKNIQIFAPAGFKASKTMIPGNVTNEEVKISLIASVPKSSGNLVIIAGSFVRTIYLIGYATPLQEKDLSIEPVYDGGADAEFVITDADGFMPENGFTIEFAAKMPATISYVQPFAITYEGVGFQSTVSRDAFKYNNSTQAWIDKNIVDQNLQSLGGSGVFLPDDNFHTYRFAVAPDNRVHVYRDGILVDYVRTQDLGLQKYMIDGEGDFEENLLVNGDFEGEYSFIKSDPGSGILGSIEGWAIGANDRYNSEQYINNMEIDQSTPINNQVLQTNRYYWSEGWGAAEYIQFVDVVPGETYSLSALARGGYSSHLNKWQGSIRVHEVNEQELVNEKKIEVNSDEWEEYSMDYTTSAKATQIRVNIYLERGDTWGNGATMYVDNVKLTGKRASYQQKIGFFSRVAEIDYFNYDATGAYAPLRKAIDLSTDKVTIDGTNKSVTIQITPVNLTEDVQVVAPRGFGVDKELIEKDAGVTDLKIVYNSALEKTEGQLVIKSGNAYSFVDLIGIGTPLVEKDLSIDPAYDGGDDTEFMVTDADGFMPENGYTVEFTAKFPAVISYVYPYAITSEGSGFQAITSKEKIGISNAGQDWVSKNFSNPASLNGVFYPDDEFHTYRYAVTPDNRLFFYYDGGLVDIVRLQDFGLQKHMIEGEGDFEENLLVNGDFEGEYSFIKSDPGSEILGSIEGWAIGANDRWNSEQYIMKQEILGVSDFNNHVFRTNRYYWADGWGAAEYIQFVDVVPGETYSLSALARGGYSSHLNKWQGSIRIHELDGQTLSNEKKVEINSDEWEEYSMDYTTSAKATQIRVNIYLERGDTWGNGATMYVDDVKLTGKRASYHQKLGFLSQAAEIGYFNYDATGAYAPPASNVIIENPSGLHNMPADGIYTSVKDNNLYLTNINDISRVKVYSANGELVADVKNYLPGTAILLRQKGFYVITVEDKQSIQKIKVIN